jgi:hypothetical protein
MKWVEDSQEKGGSNDGSKKKVGYRNSGPKKKKAGSKAGLQKKVGENASGSGIDAMNDKIPDSNVSK